MRREMASDQRAREVRDAASAWRRTGLIDGAALEEIERLYPSGRKRPGTVWRVLMFVFVCLTVGSLYLAASLFSGHTASLWLFGLVLAAATELRQRPDTRLEVEIEPATSFLSVVFIGAAFWSMLDWPAHSTFLSIWALLWALACWRWGYALYGLFAAASLFFAIGGSSAFARPVMVLFAFMLAAAANSRLDSERLAPSHRRAFAWVLAAALTALYASVNLYTLDQCWIEPRRGHPPEWVRIASAAATALFPAVVLAWGIWSRRRMLLWMGGVFAALSLATLRFYVHVAPLWLALALCGAAALAAAFALERLLARAPNLRRRGFAAEPLLESEDRQRLAETALASLAPSLVKAEAKGDRFTGGGGEFGGGGSSGTF